MTVDLIEARQVPYDARQEKRGANEITPEIYEKLYRLGDDDEARTSCDVTLIYGVWDSEGTTASLLLCRHWKGITHPPKFNTTRALYNAVFERMDQKGYVRFTWTMECVPKLGLANGGSPMGLTCIFFILVQRPKLYISPTRLQ